VKVDGRAIEVEELFPHQDGTHTHLTVKFPLFGHDGALQYVCGISTDINERKRAEEGRRQSTELQRLMLSELDHRVRNNLASLAALVDISVRDKTNVREFADSIRSRVQAMSSVHGLLSRGHWIAVSLRSLIDTLSPNDVRGALCVAGPDVEITPRQVTALGMVLQELMANSLKYGALGADGGRVDLHWTTAPLTASKGIQVDLHWQERHGPLIEKSPVPGQGTGLIEGFVRTELRGTAELSYPRTGALHRFSLRLDEAGERR
jgi:two-component sensor histidine kinase